MLIAVLATGGLLILMVGFVIHVLRSPSEHTDIEDAKFPNLDWTNQ